MIQVDEQRVRSHVEEVVRSSVESTLNGLLEALPDTSAQLRDPQPQSGSRLDGIAAPIPMRVGSPPDA